MKKQFLLYLLLAVSGLTHGQFITSGKIEYERRTNQHSMLEDEDMWDEMMKENMPKFAITYYDLIFDENKSLYQLGKEPADKRIHWALNFITNIVYKDFRKLSITTQKNIFGSDYLISDSIPHSEWKVTNEPRTIAGFECRKAVCRIYDSIVVIAFYTDEIIPANGPESFGGLPGMILGLAIPKLHTTWYATKLELVNQPPKNIAAPKEGKKYSIPQFRNEMEQLIKQREWLKKISFQMLI
jgi:GLPGLI family protein